MSAENEDNTVGTTLGWQGWKAAPGERDRLNGPESGHMILVRPVEGGELKSQLRSEPVCAGVQYVTSQRRDTWGRPGLVGTSSLVFSFFWGRFSRWVRAQTLERQAPLCILVLGLGLTCFCLLRSHL